MAGCTEVEERKSSELQRSTAAIQGGTTTTSYPFVVGIVSQSRSGISQCTGTLIAPNLVLTARHCVAATSTGDTIDCSSTFGAPRAASGFYVTTDATVSQRSNFVTVSRVDVPAAPQACGNDVALLRLSRNITGVTLGVPVVQHKIYNSVRYSRNIAALGYGVTDAFEDTNDSGTRRIKRGLAILCTDGSRFLPSCSASSPTSLSANDFLSEPGTCSGDSGGAAFDDTTLDGAAPTVLGVLSRGGVDRARGACLEAVYTRVDGQASFIISNALLAATAGGYAAPSWTVSESPDPEDAPYVPGTRPRAKNAGESCVNKRECGDSGCVDFGDDNGKVCAAGCPSGTNVECKTGYQCANKFCQAIPVPVVEPGKTEPTETEPVVTESPAATAPAATAASTPTTTTVRTSCSAREVDPTHPQPWYAGAAVVGAVLAAGRRRRR